MTDRTKTIINAVTEVLGITYQELLGTCKDAKLVEARQMLVGLIVEYGSEHSKTLCALLNRDRTTIINTKQKFEDYMHVSRPFRQKYELIKRAIMAQKIALPEGVIYIDMLVQRKEVAVELTPHEHHQTPCLSYAAHEIERKILYVQYKPGAAWVTADHVIDATLRACKRQYKVLAYQILDQLPILNK